MHDTYILHVTIMHDYELIFIFWPSESRDSWKQICKKITACTGGLSSEIGQIHVTS